MSIFWNDSALFITLVIVGALGAILIYNGLMAKALQVDNAFSSIDVMLKMRYDLIPNLVSIAKHFMKHETEVLEKLTELRMRAQGTSPRSKSREAIQLDKEFTGLYRQLVISAENYPVLKSSENFQQLQKSLADVEENIAAARRAYNAAVTVYNIALVQIPTNYFAQSLNLKRRELFEIPKEQKADMDIGKMLAS